ncbi:PadR family transcriptional regulator [Saccharothrix coeruleofusca]|uniref:PadR family transcriptional regulator n=1 Tax=Saccharothrix coeruleofusca TaxID=33919 RepID=A0A918ASJ6_9PSEU|nr:PadR family transcriptional regulator [Saccharothrix coeruleofusca]MBP2336916.1 DNA-binding PadR family transcriptional regulator [Saccharothrix coeruleofusca]GGP81930.1 PadR family transcriptional regulator [Saccharothrix coeruleofusca]
MAKRKITNTVALAVLGLLQERPMHPYEMATTLRERLKDSSFKLNSGSLYDTVEALVRHGWIEPVRTVREGRRPERTVYAHTDLGHREFLAWLDELLRRPVPEHPKFAAAVSYLGALGPEAAADALAERVEHLTRHVEEIERVLASTVGAGGLPRLFMIEAEYLLHVARAELEWTRRTVAEIRGGSLAWPEAERTDQGWTWSGQERGGNG